MLPPCYTTTGDTTLAKALLAGSSNPWNRPARRRYIPIPQDIAAADATMAMIDNLRRTEDDEAAKRVARWALGTSLTALAYRERCSARTIQTRIGETLERVADEFLAADACVDHPPTLGA